jgi:hypothetical protein
MEKVLGVFKPKPTPQEQLREWQRKLRQEARNVERQVRGMVRLFAHHPPLCCFPPSFRLPCKEHGMILIVVQSTGTKTSTSTTWWGLSCLHGVGDFCYSPPPVFILVFWLLGFAFNPEVLYCIQNFFITALLHKTLFLLQRWQKHKKAFSWVFKHTICCWWCLWSGGLFLSSWIWTYLHYFWSIW